MNSHRYLDGSKANKVLLKVQAPCNGTVVPNNIAIWYLYFAPCYPKINVRQLLMSNSTKTLPGCENSFGVMNSTDKIFRGSSTVD